jgi:hypothetical protein
VQLERESRAPVGLGGAQRIEERAQLAEEARLPGAY